MRPAVIGLYGLPGCGKSFLLNELKKHLSHSEYAFFEGSDVISSIVPGGLSTFQELEEEQKQLWRGFAIDKIVSECQDSAKTAIVAGHFMFWSQGELATVWTPKDKTAYTHIMYLDVPEGIIAKQRLDDVHRHRAEIPLAELARWQQAEIDQLSHLCQRHGILFSRLPERSRSHIATVLKLIQFSSLVITEANATRVDAKVNNFLADHAELETVVVVDADKTLSSEDTGVVFWQSLDLRRPPLGALKAQDCPLSDLFSGPLGYSEAAFLQATLLYEEAANEEDFERICDIVASKTKMYAEFVSLFRSIACHDYVRVLVVTCGIRRVWEKILHREGFSRTIQVIGGSRISDGVIVTADAKAQVVTRLRNQENLRVLAIGDSPLDLPMLEAASEAIVVTGDEHTRSRSMNDALLEAIKTRDFKARQTLLPGTVSPRLSDALLPQVCLNSDEFRGSLFSRQRGCLHSALWQATGKHSAKLLMSPTRNALIAGPALRKAHSDIGSYLAWEFLSGALGIEEYQMQHVQGHTISGYRLKHEKKTTIAALMRGGEPMALGISDTLPSAVFVHAKIPDDITKDHLDGQKTVILADSVINSGRTMIQFIEHIRKEHKDIRIVVVAGVVQEETIVRGHAFAGAMQDHDVCVGALRVSSNKFVGFKGTDTGHRLFNTTHMA